MNFSDILDSYRHNTATEYFRGAFVKEKLPLNFNPAIDIDDRPLRIIVSFSTIGVDASAITIVDPNDDSLNTLDTEEIILDELELAEYDIVSRQWAKWSNKWWRILGTEGSLLKLISFEDTSSNPILELVSYINTKQYTNDEYAALEYPTVSIDIPCNSTLIKLLDISVIGSATYTLGDTPTLYAKLEPLNTTESKVVSWSISDETICTGIEGVDTREFALTLLSAGVVTITVVSDLDTTITDSITLTITE